MSKQRKNIIMVIILSLILAITLTAFFVTKKDGPKKETDSETVSSEVDLDLKVEDIENEEKNQADSSDKVQSNFIEPDETEADKILEENKNKNNNKKNQTSSESKTDKQETTKVTSSEDKTNESSEPTDASENTQSFEDGQDILKKDTLEYLEKHNIDPKTAGETGELCQHCGKKIWNPDKYGDFIPGMPENYENSGYCLGTCAISFD